MGITGIILAAVIVGGTGLFIGVFLGIAGKKFAVETDEREDAILEVLPGNNCGGCGYAGCSGLAAAIVAGEAEVGGCPVGGAPVAEQIGKIMGVDAGAQERKTAFVKCGGTCEKAKNEYEYYGIKDCVMAAQMQDGGAKGCAYGCLGYGSCVKACPFDAIHILDPRTGYPIQNDLYQVTIISDSSVDGDALSTTCYALGLEKGMDLIESMSGVEAVFVTDDYEIHETSGVTLD